MSLICSDEKTLTLRDAEVKEDIITVLEQSPVGDSSGNGFAERAVSQKRLSASQLAFRGQPWKATCIHAI